MPRAYRWQTGNENRRGRIECPDRVRIDLHGQRRYVCRYVVQYVGQYVGRYVCRYVDQYVGRYVDQYVGRYVDQYVGRYVDQYVGRYVDQYVGRYVDQYVGRCEKSIRELAKYAPKSARNCHIFQIIDLPYWAIFFHT